MSSALTSAMVYKTPEKTIYISESRLDHFTEAGVAYTWSSLHLFVFSEFQRLSDSTIFVYLHNLQLI